MSNLGLGFIPEIFFDLIARLVPGLILVVYAIAIAIVAGDAGQAASRWELVSDHASILTVPILLTSYLVALVMKQLWELCVPASSPVALAMKKLWKLCVRAFSGRGRRSATLEEPAFPPERYIWLARIRKHLPEEGARLLKIQSEKNLCEVLIPGLTLLLILTIGLVIPRGGVGSPVVALTLGLPVCIWALWRWRRSLEDLFARNLKELSEFLAELRPDPPA